MTRDATPQEIAALVAVLVAVLSAFQTRALQTPATPTRPLPSGWSDPTRTTRRPLPPGPGAWRASALPR
ncbi:acyl-CoA carboxylase epsilon subunit [Nocardioides sp. LHG3406-4]|uniref:acyl-CoA carboxylase epsilon subunit n=1 Tax=Nocardioides sp. LHG3406-4 TaxID=2804575 RepID=UPI003CE7A6EB